MLSSFRNYIMPPSTDSDNDSVNPPLLAMTTTALARMTTREFNDITCPFDQFWDFSQKSHQDRWLVATRAEANHTPFDISVATADVFMELLKDKSDYYRWGALISIPLGGDGSFDETTTTHSNGAVAMKVDLRDRVDLLLQWTKVSTLRCQQFAQWFNGADDMLLDAPFEKDSSKRRVVALDCNDATNKGIVRRYKVQLRIIDQLVFHVLKNHLTASSFKSFLAHQHEFNFIDEKTGNQVKSGLVLMRKMLDVCKPETIVEVRHLEKELDSILLWPTHENNVRLLTTRMMTVLQEIHAKTGQHSYTDQRFITNLFRALESSPTEKFLHFVDQIKSQWIMEDISDPAQIILKLDKMHRNMVADGSWLNTNEKDTKIVALTSALQEVKKKFGDLAKKVSFDQDKPKGSSGKKGGEKSKEKRQTKARCPEWQVTKKGTTIEHDGRKYEWCSKHSSKDGSINGLYMPSPHNHDEWAKAKAEKTAAFKKRKEDMKKSPDGTPAAKKAKQDGGELKLQLGSKLTSALVTQHHMTQADAEDVFNTVFKEVYEQKLGN